MNKSGKTILERIYDGELLPRERIQPHDPAYPRTCQEAEAAYLSLCKRLNETDQQQLDHLLELHLRMDSMDGCACFSHGFRYGVLLMLEILASEDALSA